MIIKNWEKSAKIPTILQICSRRIVGDNNNMGNGIFYIINKLYKEGLYGAQKS